MASCLWFYMLHHGYLVYFKIYTVLRIVTEWKVNRNFSTPFLLLKLNILAEARNCQNKNDFSL